jgi:hypothetical protein
MTDNFPCFACKGAISVTAKSCPHCGSSDPLFLHELHSGTHAHERDGNVLTVVGLTGIALAIIGVGYLGVFGSIALGCVASVCFLIAKNSYKHSSDARDWFIKNRVESMGLTGSDYERITQSRKERNI